MISGSFSQDGWDAAGKPVRIERPLPVVEEVWIRVWLPQAADYRLHSSPYRGVLDTAATSSIVPMDAFRFPGCPRPTKKRVTTVLGTEEGDFWPVRLQIGDLSVGVVALGKPRRDIILGLDFLGKLSLLANFPSQQWRLGQSPQPAGILGALGLWLCGLGHPKTHRAND